MESEPLEILYEDNHCLAIAKPSGVASAHFQGEDETLDRLRLWHHALERDASGLGDIREAI